MIVMIKSLRLGNTKTPGLFRAGVSHYNSNGIEFVSVAA
jgi:hypothetical protein